MIYNVNQILLIPLPLGLPARSCLLVYELASPAGWEEKTFLTLWPALADTEWSLLFVDRGLHLPASLP